MIKRYYLIVKKYFGLGANNKKLLFHLIFSATLRSLSLLLLPITSAKIVEYATIKDFNTTFIWILLFLLASLLYVLFHHYNFVSYRNNSLFIHNKLQQLILKHVTSYDENFSNEISVPYIVNTAFNDVSNVVSIPDRTFDTITETISMILAIIILIKVNFYIGLITLILMIITVIFMFKNMEKKEFYLTSQRQHQDNISGLMGQVIDGNKEIKAFNMKDDIKNYLEKYKKQWKTAYFKKRKYNDIVYVLVPMILGFGKIIIYSLSIYFILKGRYEISMLILIIGYYENIQNEFNKLFKSLNDISINSTRVDRIYKVLNYKTNNMVEFGENNNDNIKGKIEFNGVCFTYEDVEVLKDINLKIMPNTFTAIVGKSGSGKSTIFRLLLRLYKLDEGKILLDNEDIYSYSKDVYSSNISIVTQKPFIFDMSIRDNLNLIDSSFDNQVEACKKVHIHDYIMSLKDGYNTKMIMDATNISSGQKQLLALARTLLSKSEVLLFDEVTSSLDINTAKQIIEILKDLKKDHTIIMITHKPELMKMADEIIVVDNGRIVGKGSHKDLMKDNKYYKILQK